MKSWQIFGIGVAAILASVLLRLYEPVVAALAALLLLGVAAFGFLLRPRRDIFYVRTTTWRADVERNLLVEHEQLAVKVEIAHLWLLFIPTSLAVAFLVVTAAQGTIWRFSLVDWISGTADPTWLVFMGRMPLIVVVGILSAWISERWVLRDAEACSARSVSVSNGRVGFMFVDHVGHYQGGDCLGFPFLRTAPLATLVVYNVAKPELNKIGMGLLFHRFVIIGRGLTDLDRKTVAAHTALAETAS